MSSSGNPKGRNRYWLWEDLMEAFPYIPRSHLGFAALGNGILCEVEVWADPFLWFYVLNPPKFQALEKDLPPVSELSLAHLQLTFWTWQVSNRNFLAPVGGRAQAEDFSNKKTNFGKNLNLFLPLFLPFSTLAPVQGVWLVGWVSGLSEIWCQVYQRFVCSSTSKFGETPDKSPRWILAFPHLQFFSRGWSNIEESQHWEQCSWEILWPLSREFFGFIKRRANHWKKDHSPFCPKSWKLMR